MPYQKDLPVPEEKHQKALRVQRAPQERVAVCPLAGRRFDPQLVRIKGVGVLGRLALFVARRHQPDGKAGRKQAEDHGRVP